jgi:hypothetical protein
MNVTASLTDIGSKSGSLNTSIDHAIRIAAPKSFTDKDLAKLRRDCEIILDRIKNHPDKMQAMMKLVFSGDLSGAQRLAKELKLAEADFEKEGGGCFILLCLICISALMTASYII